MTIRPDDPDGLVNDHVYIDGLDGDLIGPNNELTVHDKLDEDHVEYSGPKNDDPDKHTSLNGTHNALKDRNPNALAMCTAMGVTLVKQRDLDGLCYVHTDHNGLDNVHSVRLNPCSSRSVLPSL